MGPAPGPAGEGIRVPCVEAAANHADAHAPPVPRPLAPQLEDALLRRSLGEHEAQRHRCVHCRPHAAHGRGRARLRDRRPASGSSASSAARCGARRRLRSRADARARARALRARPGAPQRSLIAGRSTRLPGPVDPVTLHVNIDRPREEVFAYLADVANHPEFTDHFLKDWRLTREDSEGRGAGRALPPGRPLRPLRLLRPHLAELDAAAPDRRRRPRRQVQPDQDVPPVDARAGRRRHAAGVRLRDRAAAADRPASSRQLSGRRGWFRRNAARALRRLRSILEENRDRGARATVAGSRLTAAAMSRLARIIAARRSARSPRCAAGCGNKEEQVRSWPRPRASTSRSTTSSTRSRSRASSTRRRPRTRRTWRAPRGRGRSSADEVWFGIFMRVENDTDEPHEMASQLTIIDTQGNIFEPIELDPAISDVRLPADRARARLALPAARHARVRQHDPGRPAALQGQDRVALQPPARAPHREPDRRPGRRRSTSTSDGLQRRLEHGARDRRGRLAAGARADEHDRDRHLRLAHRRVGREPGVRVGRGSSAAGARARRGPDRVRRVAQLGGAGLAGHLDAGDRRAATPVPDVTTARM